MAARVFDLSGASQEGEPFPVKGGRYQVAFKGNAGDLTLQIDVEGDWVDNEEWADTSGVFPVWLSAHHLHRVITDAAGAIVVVSRLDERVSGPEV